MDPVERHAALLRLTHLKRRVRELETRLGVQPSESIPNLPSSAQLGIVGLFADFAADLLSVHEADGEYVWVSRNSESLFGWTPEELQGRSAYDFFYPQDVSVIAENHAAQLNGAAGLVRYRFRCASDDYRWVETRSRMGIGGRYIMAITRDVHGEQELLETLERRASYDLVTELPNRYALEESLRQELARNRRSDKPLSIITCDIDGFKAVNDASGHAAGDAHLLEIGRRFSAVRRLYDVAGRWGGDEFLIILPETTIREAVGVAERLRWAVTEIGVGTTLSVGISSTSSAENLQELLRQADEALYRAKALGGDRVIVAQPSVDDPSDDDQSELTSIPDLPVQ